jgi:ABC-type amino acid transport substrate-binding protein
MNSHIHRAHHVGLIALTVLTLACSSLPGVAIDNVLNLDDIAQIAETPAPIATDVPPVPAPPTVSTAALVKQRTRIRVGIRYDAPPLTRVNAEGELEGMDVDLAREFARRWLGSERNVEFIQVTSQTAPQKIANREIDLAMGGLIHTKPAELLADFSLSYLRDGEALLARTGTYSDFVSLAGRTVTYIDAPSTVALSAAQIANNVTVTLQSQTSYRAAVNELLAGSTDGVVGRWRRLRATAAGDPALNIPIVFTNEPIAIMLPQNDSAWAHLVNVTLSVLVADGTFARLHEQWFGFQPDAVGAMPQTNPLQLIDLPDAVTLRTTLTTIQTNDVVRVGISAQVAPFVTVAENGTLGGFDLDLAREMTRRWLVDPAKAQFIPLNPTEVATALAAGQVDMAVGNVQRTAANDKLMSFSIATYMSGNVPIGIALPQNDSRFRDLANFTLQDMQADGVYQQLFAKWFPDQTLNVIEAWPGAGSAASLLSAPTQ